MSSLWYLLVQSPPARPHPMRAGNATDTVPVLVDMRYRASRARALRKYPTRASRVSLPVRPGHPGPYCPYMFTILRRVRSPCMLMVPGRRIVLLLYVFACGHRSNRRRTSPPAVVVVQFVWWAMKSSSHRSRSPVRCRTTPATRVGCVGYLLPSVWPPWPVSPTAVWSCSPLPLLAAALATCVVWLLGMA